MGRARIVTSLVTVGLFGACGPEDLSNTSVEDALGVSETIRYRVEVRPIEICGRRHSSIVVEPTSGRVVVQMASFQVPGSGRSIVLPDRFVQLDSHGSDLAVLPEQDAFFLEISDPLLPRPPPVSSDESVLQRYCDFVAKFTEETYARAPRAIRTPILTVRVGAAGELIDARPQLVESANHAGVATPEKTASGGTKALIIYSPGYELQAFELRDYRLEKGIAALALNVTDLPGYHADDPVPDDCLGDYFPECYFAAGESITVSPGAVPALFGMVNEVPIGGTYERVPDVAGIVRASIRRLKRANPALAYVALVGDPYELPSRFTSRNAYGTQTGRVFTLPSDFYFREPNRPWAPTGRVNYAPSSELVWPCGANICSEPNTDWNTTHFVWPVDYPFARTFHDPLTPGNPPYTAAELSSMVAVGRIHGRTPEAIDDYVDKLRTWEAHPRVLRQNAIVSDADAVYSKQHLTVVKEQLGPFAFFGEGFGSGYLTENVPPDCMASRPPENDWDVPGWNSMWQYQQQDSHCKPEDPAKPDYYLPSPDEVLAYASEHGFSMFLMQGHGSSRTIGLNTKGFNKRPRQQFATPMPFDPNQQLHDNVSIEAMQWSSGRGSGFLVSSACDPGEYLGGHTATSLMRAEPTFGEFFTNMAHGGGVGAYVNYLEGWYGGDPSFDLQFLSAARAVHESSTNRIGDAVTSFLSGVLLNGSSSRYQVLNRTFFGDPAAVIARKDFAQQNHEEDQ